MENARKSKSLQNPIRGNMNTSGLYRPTMINLSLFSMRNGNHHSRNLISYFVLFFACLHVVIPVYATEEEFPKEKCEAALPECHCEEGYMDVAMLNCLNLSNFETFTRTLSDGSVFEVNTKYDISLTGVRVLPYGFLKGLKVERLYIYDIQTEVVEDGAFDGILQLKKFQVQVSSIKEIPDFRPVRDSLRNLNLDNSRLTSISGDRLKNLTNLETVSFVNNSIQSVASDAFEDYVNVDQYVAVCGESTNADIISLLMVNNQANGLSGDEEEKEMQGKPLPSASEASIYIDAFLKGTENVMVFDLSYNQLRNLPQNLFNSWKKLSKVSLTSNLLLHVDQLFAIARPRFIYLDHNNLTDLDSILHPNMSEVETLLLSYNPFSKITEKSFNSKVKNVANIYMDHCLIREFNASHFKDLSHLSTLDLSYNLIGNVTNQKIQSGSDHGIELIFTGNKIQEFNLNLTYNVMHVNLDKNLLTSVSRSLQYSQLLDVNMAENRIETLGPEDFHGMQGVQNVNLQGNLISRVDSVTFMNIRSGLVHLDLSRNRIRSLQGCVRNLYRLTSLNLTGNMIEFFEEDEFQGLDELLDFYLDGNLITTLGNEMQRLSQLQHLSIINNRIFTLKPEQFSQTLKFIYLEGNPLKCDCQFLPFLLNLNSSSIETDGPLCTPFNQTSLLPPAECPDGCHCFCTQHKDKHFMSVDCSFAGLTELPRLFTTECSSTTKENCSSMAIHVPRGTQFSQNGPFAIEDEIGGVNLTHNNLQSLEGAQLPGGMCHLFLDNNNLQKPPLPLLYSLENLKNMTLSGNPWSCDCDLLSFKEWILYKSEIVADANETRCGSGPSELSGRVIWSLTDMDLCPVSTGSSISPVIGLLCFFLVVAVAALVLMLHWSKVKMWLSVHGVTCFHEYGVIQNKEAENLLRMNGLENQQRGRGAEGLASFPLPDDDSFRPAYLGVGAELHIDSGSSFQEQPIDRLSTDRCVSLTSQSKLPM